MPTPCSPPARPIAAQDYTPTPYLVDTVHLDFVLGEEVAKVNTRQRLTPNHATGGAAPALFLNGAPVSRLAGCTDTCMPRWLFSRCRTHLLTPAGLPQVARM